MLAELPTNVVRDIEYLSKKTGEGVQQIIEKSVVLYRRSLRNRRSTLSKGQDEPEKDELEKIRDDPEKGPIFREIMDALRARSVRKMTPKQRAERATKGALAKHKRWRESQERAKEQK